MKTLSIVVYSQTGCTDAIVREMASLDQYLSRHVRDRVVIRNECVCSAEINLPVEAGNLDVPVVRVGRHLLVNPSLAEVLDAIQVLSALGSSAGPAPRAG